MADLVIKGMEMPTCCDQCFALDDDGDYPMCRITHETRGYNFRVRELRMDKCPFVEIKTPHGRLIDANELELDLVRHNGAIGFELIGNAPTIVPAEGVKDNG